jgi:hypothetical protein
MMEDTHSTQQSAVSAAQETVKKPYVRPELVRYGDLKTLTQATLSGSQLDFTFDFS